MMTSGVKRTQQPGPLELEIAGEQLVTFGTAGTGMQNLKILPIDLFGMLPNMLLR
jgi:hypothetical protein